MDAHRDTCRGCVLERCCRGGGACERERRRDCVTCPTLGSADDLATAIASLDARAKAAWRDLGRAHRWTLWVRLSWAWPVSEGTASRHVARWAMRLRQR